MPKLKLTETVLCDGQEALAGARMTTEEMVFALQTLDKINYQAIEVFGGDSFDVCLRSLNEDPWDRLRNIRSNITRTKLQMTVRGQSLAGYRNFADDMVQYFLQKAIANGIDIVRVYDPLNDIRNMATAISAVRKESKHVQGTICYTESPVHSTERFLDYAEQLISIGVDSLCIMDKAGLLRPYEAFQLIKALRANYKLPIQLHTHETTGMAAMTILKAVEVGVDQVDVALSPFASGNSLSATESMVSAFRNTPYAPDIDTDALALATDYFIGLRKKYMANGTIHPSFLKIDTSVLTHQMPSGIHSHLFEEMCRFNGPEVLGKVLEEIPFVRADAGYPPLVTPIAEIIYTQALQNVLDGTRYKTVTPEFFNLIAGRYGRLPMPVALDFQQKILGDVIPITHRPADTLAPEVENYRAKVAPYAMQEEDLLSLAMLEEVAIKFFEWRKNRYGKLDARAAGGSSTHPV